MPAHGDMAVECCLVLFRCMEGKGFDQKVAGMRVTAAIDNPAANNRIETAASRRSSGALSHRLERDDQWPSCTENILELADGSTALLYSGSAKTAPILGR